MEIFFLELIGKFPFLFERMLYYFSFLINVIFILSLKNRLKICYSQLHSLIKTHLEKERPET